MGKLRPAGGQSLCVHLSESSEQSPNEGTPSPWHVVQASSSSPVLPSPFCSVLPSPLSSPPSSPLGSSLQLSPSLSSSAFASLLTLPQLSQLLSLAAAAGMPSINRDPSHPPHGCCLRNSSGWAWCSAFCLHLPNPSAQSSHPCGAGCYFRCTQGLTERSRDLPAPKLGLAGFHRHRHNRCTHTPPFQHTEMCSNTLHLKEPPSHICHSHMYMGTQTQEEQTEQLLAKPIHFKALSHLKPEAVPTHPPSPHPLSVPFSVLHRGSIRPQDLAK